MSAYQPADLDDLFSARERFLSTGELVAGVRPVVAQSWQRARAYGLAPERLRPQEPDARALDRARAQSRVLFEHGAPLLEEMSALLDESPHLLALADPRGRILRLLASGVSDEALNAGNLFEGASWHERDIGCNGVGTAVVVGDPVALIGPEHFQDAYVGWTCIGVPIRDANQEIVGILDLSVPNQVLDVRTWGWVLSVVRVLEARLGSGHGVIPARAELGASFSDPLSAVRGVFDLLGLRLATLPSHQRLVRQGLSRLGEVEARLARVLARAHELEGRLADVERDTDRRLAELAHEIRAPLGTIQTAVDLLDHAGSAQPEVERATRIMRRQLSVLARLAADLSEPRGSMQTPSCVEMEPLDLRQVIEDACTSSSAQIERRRHALRVRGFETPLWVMGDRVRLQQALVNLLSNAAKYTEPGGQIELTCAREGADVVVSIRDSGCGISAERLARIFDPFSRVDDAQDRAEGRGLGLALVQETIERHGGRVAATSRGRGHGSLFTLWLPTCAEEPTDRLPTDPRLQSEATA